MPDWWNAAWVAKGDEKPEVLIIRLVAAAGLGFAIALVRTFARSEGRPTPGLRTTLLLLTVLTSLITQVIGDSTARAFGLAGVLAVVRFRTVVEDTRDSAFVIFAMAIGMAVGAGYLSTSLVGFSVVSLVAIVVTQLTGQAAHDAKMTLRVKGKETTEADIRAILAKVSQSVTLSGADTVKESAESIDLVFRFRPYQQADLTKLIEQLRAKPGIEKVAWELK
jgi:uncharacterized membrane protein YhiD involved in acid resistance